MKVQELHSELNVEYQNLLDMLSNTIKYLEGLNIDPAIVKSNKKLLRYLRSRPPETILEILGGTTPLSQKAAKIPIPDLTHQEILSMSIEKILGLACNEEAPRKHLEQIAVVRFGMTRGGLSALRNRLALAEKIRTLVNNENTHESIARAAEQHGTAI